MRIALSHYSVFHGWRAGEFPLETFARAAADWGFDAIETLDVMLPEDRGTIRWEALALPVAAISITNNPFGDESAARQKVLAGALDAAASGASHWRVYAGDANPPPTDATLRAIEHLHLILDVAPAGVRVCLENHGQCFATPDQLLPILQSFEGQLALNFDTANWLLREVSPVAAAEALQPHVGMIHAKDFRVDPAGWIPGDDGQTYVGCDLGDGSADVAACIAHLHAQTDLISVEYEGTERPEIALPRAVQFLKGLLS